MAERPIKLLPSQERLRELFNYDPTTGSLVRRSSRQGNLGCISDQGYLRVKIGRQVYSVHRVIWKIATGSEPPSMLDHIDGNRLNNRVSNLRAASHGDNQQNSGRQRNNTSGHKGVSWSRTHKSWQASIMGDGKSVWLGRYKNLEDAVKVVADTRNRLHGEFARQI